MVQWIGGCNDWSGGSALSLLYIVHACSLVCWSLLSTPSTLSLMARAVSRKPRSASSAQHSALQREGAAIGEAGRMATHPCIRRYTMHWYGSSRLSVPSLSSTRLPVNHGTMSSAEQLATEQRHMPRHAPPR